MQAVMQQHMKRIESLATKVLRTGFDDAQDLWKFQEDLLDLQRDIQRKVTESKDADPSAFGTRADWETVRWHARRLGDAFAWLVMGVERKAIFPLAENTRVPIPGDDPGSRGVLAIAAHLASEGWGFPLLHDVTDVLRIGDITFIRPEMGANGLRTVEVKTSVTATRVDDGDVWEDLQVTVVHHSASDLDDVERLPVERIAVSGPVGRRPHDRLLRSPRTRRQLQRMSDATLRQTAPDDEVVQVGGSPWLSLSVDEYAGDHWPVVRRIIGLARQEGYACETVDDALLYVALYDKDGVTAESLAGTSLAEDVIKSGILETNQPERNSIVLYGVPVSDQRRAALSLPFYLYPIPRRAVFDMLWGRLHITVLVNPAKIAEALESVGFEVTPQGDGTDMKPESLIVTSRINLPDGSAAVAELHNIEYYIPELVHEFRKLSHLVSIATALRDGVARAKWSNRAGVRD